LEGTGRVLVEMEKWACRGIVQVKVGRRSPKLLKQNQKKEDCTPKSKIIQRHFPQNVTHWDGGHNGAPLKHNTSQSAMTTANTKTKGKTNENHRLKKKRKKQ